MTTDCLTTYDTARREPVQLSGERIAAAITAVAYVLLLPGAVFLMSALQA